MTEASKPAHNGEETGRMVMRTDPTASHDDQELRLMSFDRRNYGRKLRATCGSSSPYNCLEEFWNWEGGGMWGRRRKRRNEIDGKRRRMSVRELGTSLLPRGRNQEDEHPNQDIRGGGIEQDLQNRFENSRVLFFFKGFSTQELVKNLGSTSHYRFC